MGQISLDADVREFSILRYAPGCVGEWIRAGGVGQVILTDEPVRGEQRGPSNDLRVAGGDVEGVDLLVLVLTQIVLIQRVRYVERRPRGLHVQMERAIYAGVRVETVEDGRAGPMVVQRDKLRRIQEPIGLQAAERDEVTNAVGPGTEVRLERRAAERAEGAGDAPRRLLLVQTRLGDDVDNKAALVAVFGRRHAGNHFHGLHGVRRDLIRVHAALLVRHRLIVDGELGL